MRLGVFEELMDASPLQAEVRVVGQQGIEGQAEEAVQRAASGVDGGDARGSQYDVLLLRIGADVFQEGRFARTGLSRQEK